MVDQALSAPIAVLLRLGAPIGSQEVVWPDYQEYGICEEHISALIGIATNLDLIQMTDENDPGAWAPVHAWRALGQLRAVEAIEPLIGLLHGVSDNDWVIEEMPFVFALIGEPAYLPLVEYLNSVDYPVYSRLIAAGSLRQIALREPRLHASVVEVLAQQLSTYRKNSPGMNGVLIANLVELGAFEKTELIHRVFVDSKVDRFIVGDWRDIRLRLRRDQEQFGK